MKIDKYISELKKGVGIEKATQIAKARMDGTAPSNWQHLPNGPVFFKKDKRGSEGMDESHLTHLHNWWTQVYYRIKKIK